MSVDFAVFDTNVAPRTGSAFRAWVAQQTDWDGDGPDPETGALSPSLKQWYDAMNAQFPDLTRSGAQGPEAIDYSFSPWLIYCSMTSSQQADPAWALAKDLAARFRVGTYDPMSDDGRSNKCIVFPDGPLANDPSWLSRIFGKS